VRPGFPWPSALVATADNLPDLVEALGYRLVSPLRQAFLNNRRHSRPGTFQNSKSKDNCIWRAPVPAIGCLNPGIGVKPEPNTGLIWETFALLVQAIDISDATHPKQAGFFMPQPIPVVGTEDPALSAGPATTVSELLNPNVNDPDFKTKVVMWSYPIIKDGLIYVIDIRNGLYILRYTGPHSDQVENTQFREGNSTVGNNEDEGEGDR
jgi:hypothetical protein